MGSVVVGVSFDADLQSNATIAAALARAMECGVRLVNVSLEPIGGQAAAWGEMLAEWTRDLGVEAGFEHILGDPVQELLRLCDSRRTELLVIGAASAQARDSGFLGGIAMRVIRGVTDPVLVVPPGARVRPNPGRWRLLYPVDFNHRCRAGVGTLLGYATALPGASVHLLHVVKRGREQGVWLDRSSGSAEPARAVSARLEGALAELEQFELGDDVSSESHVVASTDVPRAILDEADRLDADAIVIATAGRGALGAFVLGSVAAMLVRHADRPVFVVKP